MSSIISKFLEKPTVNLNLPIKIGDTISFSNKSWLYIHYQPVLDLCYFALKYEESLLYSTYSEQNSVLTSFESSMTAESLDLCEYNSDNTDHKVFIPSVNEITDKYIYFTGANKRIFSSRSYWTTSIVSMGGGSYIQLINGKGTLSDGTGSYPSTTTTSSTTKYIIRPFICIKSKNIMNLHPILFDVGSNYTLDNKSWTCVHYDSDNNLYYMALASGLKSYTKVAFGNKGQYAGSTLATAALNYENTQLSSDLLNKCVYVTINDVTAKVFVPSIEQLNYDAATGTGFSYFTSDDRRKLQTNDGASFAPTITDVNWWTSSQYNTSGAYYISTAGAILSTTSVSSTSSLRPFICIDGSKI